jgi:hypothetical protein
MDKKHEPVKATAEQIEQWGKHERDDLDARHQRAASELEQRHRLELQKSQSKQQGFAIARKKRHSRTGNEPTAKPLKKR